MEDADAGEGVIRTHARPVRHLKEKIRTSCANGHSHNLRTLSTSIAPRARPGGEAAELTEHTQWTKDADLHTLATEH